MLVFFHLSKCRKRWRRTFSASLMKSSPRRQRKRWQQNWCSKNRYKQFYTLLYCFTVLSTKRICPMLSKQKKRFACCGQILFNELWRKRTLEENMQHPSLPRVRRGWSGRERHTREKGRSSLRRNSPGKELKYIRNNHLMLNFVIQKFSMRKKRVRTCIAFCLLHPKKSKCDHCCQLLWLIDLN